MIKLLLFTLFASFILSNFSSFTRFSIYCCYYWYCMDSSFTFSFFIYYHFITSSHIYFSAYSITFSLIVTGRCNQWNAKVDFLFLWDKIQNPMYVYFTGRLHLSDRAHIVFDFHQAIDGLNEAKLGDKKLGTHSPQPGQMSVFIAILSLVLCYLFLSGSYAAIHFYCASISSFFFSSPVSWMAVLSYDYIMIVFWHGFSLIRSFHSLLISSSLSPHLHSYSSFTSLILTHPPPFYKYIHTSHLLPQAPHTRA